MVKMRKIDWKQVGDNVLLGALSIGAMALCYWVGDYERDAEKKRGVKNSENKVDSYYPCRSGYSCHFGDYKSDPYIFMEYKDAVKAVLNDQSMSQYHKSEVLPNILKDADSDYYAAIASIANSDMGSYYKHSAIVELSENWEG